MNKLIRNTLVPLIALFFCSMAFAGNVFIPDITKVPTIGTGIIVLHGGGMSLPGCTSNYDPVAGDKSQEIREGAKSLMYTTSGGTFSKCFAVSVESSAPIPYINLNTMALKYPAVDSATYVRTTATELVPQPFTISEGKNKYGISLTIIGKGDPNSITYFQCAVEPFEKGRMEQLGFIGKFSPVGFIAEIRFSVLGLENVEPYKKCSGYRMTLDPTLFLNVVEPPPVQCNEGCVPAP